MAAEMKLYKELNRLGVKPYDVGSVKIVGSELVCHTLNGVVVKFDDPYMVELGEEAMPRVSGENGHLKRIYGMAVLYAGEKRPFSSFAEDMSGRSAGELFELERKIENNIGLVPYGEALTDKLYAEVSRELTRTVPFPKIADMDIGAKLNALALMSEGKSGPKIAKFFE